MPAKPRNAAFGVLLLVAALNLAALAVRAAFVARSGAFAATTGYEEFCLYNIWKAAHGLPVYEWPLRGHYLVSIYNAGFYHLYAAWSRLWRADGPALVPCLRWLTLLFGAAGMAIQAHLLRGMAPRSHFSGAWVWALSFLTWFATTYSGWSGLTARPDIPAVALALAGLALALRAREKGARSLWLAASLLFFAAWSIKQTVIWIFVGTLPTAYLGRRRLGDLLCFALPCCALAAALLAAGGGAYRFNVLVAPRIFRWLPVQGAELAAQAVALNLFPWAFGAWALWEAARAWKTKTRPAEGADPLQRRRNAAVIAAIPALLMGGLQLTIDDSGMNNIFEGFAMISLLGGAAWLGVWKAGAPGRALAAGALLLATMAPLPAVQLALAARGVPNTKIHNVSIGNLTKLNGAQLEQRRRFAVWIGTLPKPLWMRDAMFQMPWFATDNAFPAFPLNPDFEADAQAIGAFEGRGFADWIWRRHFACLLLRPGDPMIREALQAGYRPRAIPKEFRPRLATDYGLERPAPILFVIPPSGGVTAPAAEPGPAPGGQK